MHFEEPTIEIQSTVFVIDDDAEVRKSIAGLLAGSGLPMQLFGSAEEFLNVYNPAWPGCLVLDLRLPGITGLELQKHLRDISVELPVIILSGHGSIAACVQTMKMGALDFIEKPFREEVLLDCIYRAISIDKQNRRIRMEKSVLLARFNSLTKREREVLPLLTKGISDKNIASLLGITQRGASFHRQNILNKMQVSTVIELAKLASILSENTTAVERKHSVFELAIKHFGREHVKE
jgi:FixJ family two-component response regulator